MKKSVLALLLLLSVSFQVYSQQVGRGLTATNGEFIGFYEYKPTDYNVDPNIKYPVIIFLHGIGERGNGTTDLPRVLSNAIPRYINSGHNMRFTWNGKTETFLVLSPQLSNAYGGWQMFYIDEMIKYARNNLRIDTNRIILTGLSLGGGGAWNYVTTSFANAQKLAALAPVCGVCPVGNACNISNANLPVWAFHAINDGTVAAGCTNGTISNIIACNPGVMPYKSIYPDGGHGIWDRSYDTQYNWHNPNIYEWFLNQDKSLPINKLPVANAGNNITIGSSAGLVNLSGSASYDPDGSIVRYIWQKISGPSFGSISNPVSTNGITSVTGLNMAGTYQYELKVADNRASWTLDTVTVTVVLGSMPNMPPVTNAGADYNSILTTAPLNGAATYDPDGSIISYRWRFIDGPPQYIIGNTSAATTNVSSMVNGTYRFELESTDNMGARTRDTVLITEATNVLPVKLVSFSLTKQGADNELQWITEEELNMLHYELERSEDGLHFNSIGLLPANGKTAGQSAYHFTDRNPGSSKIFYRLKMVQRDNKFEYSSIIHAGASVSKEMISLYPNPFTDQIRITITDNYRGPMQVNLWSMEGRLVFQQQINKQSESVLITPSALGWQKGMFMLETWESGKRSAVQKIIKQ